MRTSRPLNVGAKASRRRAAKPGKKALKSKRFQGFFFFF